MIIDVHTHVGSDIDGSTQSVEKLLAVMDSYGIDMSVIFPFNERDGGATFRRANDMMADAMRTHPGRLIGFCRIDPYYGREACMELDRALGMGLRGLKLHPKSQRFSLDHPVVSRLLGTLEDAGLPLLLHAEKWNPATKPDQIELIARRFPGLTVIAAHAGYAGPDILPVAREHSNVYVDISLSSLFMIRKALASLDIGKILFGSDAPYSHPKVEMMKLELVEECSARETERILGGNAARLLLPS